MDVEKWVYRSSIEHLIQYPEMSRATDLLKDWSKLAKGKNLAAAACLYLTKYVIPTLQGLDCAKKPIPLWVKRRLFDDLPQEITSIEEWLSLFSGTIVEALNERFKGSSIVMNAANVKSDDLEDAKNRGYGVFFTPNGYHGKRSSESITQANAFFADFDDGTKEEQRAIIDQLDLKPSVIVESKRGYHLYWLLLEPLKDFELWKRVQESIIRACSSDPAIKDLARLMRLPFSWHVKSDEPWFVKITEWNALLYDLNDVVGAFPPAEQARERFRFKRQLELSNIPDIEQLGPGERHVGLLEQATKLYARSRPENSSYIRKVLRDWYEHSSKPLKDGWEKEVDDLCDWIESRQFSKIS